VWAARLLELAGAAASQPARTWRPAAVLAAAVVLAGLLAAPGWQNGVRAAMGMGPVEGSNLVATGVIALAVAMALGLLGRAFQRAWLILSNMLLVVLPARAALLAGFVAVSAAVWGVGSGVVARAAVAFLDAAYARLDALIPPDDAAPTHPDKSGSSASLVTWASLGAQGRDHVLAQPDKAAIEALSGAPAKEPLRVYVGLNAGAGPAERAKLALAELLRVGAFSRANLVISTPTGTGWVDPAASAPMEHLLGGDVATVSVQYSYLPSWLSLLVEPEDGAETARQVFRAVYGHWAGLPPQQRPRLYLFGLSLGSLNSDLSVDVYDILAAPYHGALWAGPPFRSRTWRATVGARNAGTPVWRPRYSDGRMFRFATQEDTRAEAYAPWGPLRVIYLQYPSDPIVFFEPGSVFRRPRIVDAPRPPDVSPDLSWMPVVSFLQMVVDMVTATGTPRGFGHVYAAEHYMNAWVALLDPPGWPQERLDRLRRHLAASGL
jgi:uncharacterized membrane protein